MSQSGGTHSEQDVKATLDNCRLTYVYEPDRGRLRTRVSHLLGAGMVVAWFQGAGVATSGIAPGRAVICDPSNRWARENVNRFFRRLPIESPLSLVAATGTAPWHDGHLDPCNVRRVAVDGAWRSYVVSAVDRDGCVDALGMSEAHDSGLFELIRDHSGRTGVPALIAVPFCAPAEPAVGTPREAIRTMFSSSIDVLVIERFVLAKDQWILGTHAR